MANEPHVGILNKTLGEILQNNTQAQGMIMKAMQISPEKFHEMLGQAGNNQLMNMTIGDLFKNGVVQQATQMNQPGGQMPGQIVSGQLQQVSQEQLQQVMGILQNGQPLTQDSGNIVGVEQIPAQVVPKSSFFQKIIGFFK